MNASKFTEVPKFNGKRKHEGLAPPEMRRMNQREDENAKRPKLMA
jgi:hypothetical protein